MYRLAIPAIFILASGLYAHKFHAGLTQLEYNEETRALEIVLRLFADDLENILSTRSGKAVRLDRDPDIESKAHAYIRERFRIKDRTGKILVPRWVGMEYEVDTVWLYLELALPDGPQGLELRNRVFFDLFRDQVNTVNIKHGKHKKTLIYKWGDDFKPLVD